MLGLTIFGLSSCLHPKTSSSLYGHRHGDRSPSSLNSALIEKAMQHPTSEIIKDSKDSQDYIRRQLDLFNRIDEGHSLESSTLFGQQLTPKEKASIFHQKDLFSAYLKNQELTDSLTEVGFDGASYLSGSYESDLGKLKSYQNLFTEKSPKGDLFYLFIQGKGPQKSMKELHKALDEMNEPALPFLNPNVSIKELRQIFKDYPILKGFLHELPGMIDAVLAFETGLINAKEFREQIHVNLFHCGPSAGYWQLLKSHLIPQSFERNNEKRLFQRIFKDSLFMKDGDGILYYGAPSTFESFVSTLFDRLSQATRGGYLKIDWEIGGDPIHNANSLLLEKNIPWTIEQLSLLKDQAKLAKLLKPQQKKLLQSIISKSIDYLEKYQGLLKERVLFKRDASGVTLEVSLKAKDKANQVFKAAFLNSNGHYLVDAKDTKSQEVARRLIHHKMNEVFLEVETEIGDPFQGLNWPN